MKLGILGSGKIVQEALPMIVKLPLEKIVLWGREKSREKLEGIVRQYRLDGLYFDYGELLQSDIDTVYIALPNDLHYAYTKEALEAGKHVILEKPAVVTAKELQELKECAASHHVILVEAMSVHHLPLFQQIKDAIDEIGDIKIVSLNFSQYSSRYDRFKEGIIAPAFDPKHYGGALMDLNVYNIHFLLGLFGKPKRYTYHANMERDIDTSGILVMEYDDFQACLIGAKDCEAPTVSTIQGTKGLIRIDEPVNRMTEGKVILNDGTTRSLSADKEIYRLQYEFEEFIRIITSRDQREADRLMTISEAAAEILERCAYDAGLFR